MRSVVIDTSALLRLYIPDGPIPDQLTKSVEGASRGDIELLAPELGLAEAAQVVLKKERAGFLTGAEAKAVQAAVLALPIEWIGHRELLETADGVARRHHLSIYDGLFFALAQMRGSALITADQALQKAWSAAKL